MKSPEIITRAAQSGGYETLITDDTYGLIAYGQGSKNESAIIATNRMHENRRLILIALAAGLGRWLTMAEICKGAELPTAIVQYHIRQLLREARITEHEDGGSYRKVWE